MVSVVMVVVSAMEEVIKCGSNSVPVMVVAVMVMMVINDDGTWRLYNVVRVDGGRDRGTGISISRWGLGVRCWGCGGGGVGLWGGVLSGGRRVAGRVAWILAHAIVSELSKRCIFQLL